MSILTPLSPLYLFPEFSLHRRWLSTVCPLFKNRLDLLQKLWKLRLGLEMKTALMEGFSNTSQLWDIVFSRPKSIHLSCSESESYISWHIPLCVSHLWWFSTELSTQPRLPCTRRRAVSLFSRFSIVHCSPSTESILSTVLDRSSRSPEAESPK